MTTATACPCGTKKNFSECCEPHISGKTPAPTAEALMRARYSAYATGKIDFIEKTHAPESRADFDRKASEKWAKDSQWRGLHVIATKGGGPGDATGIVSFIAGFAQNGQDYEHHEIATFRKEGATWFFVDGKSPKAETVVNTGPDVGRNDPCHCGSNKKFKKCHGK
ncbi:MAG: YchJ family protein [Elusimicrobiota bacterium]|nr:MAG: YchJ family protein [Elusimicrobiota bacterium]